MELTGDVSIAAPRARVWAALNDPEVLARCIDGVETLVRVAGADGERFEGRMNARVGPVRASFAGHVVLADVVAPQSYRLVGEGKGGVAGFARGEAVVTLAEAGPNATMLGYQVTSSVGGKLAQLGARLIEGAAKGYATSFFAKLKAELETGDMPLPVAGAPGAMPELPAGAAAGPESPGPPPPGPAPEAPGLSPLIWGGLVIAGVLGFLVWQWGIGV